MAELGFKLGSVSLQGLSSFQPSTISLGWDSEDLSEVAEETRISQDRSCLLTDLSSGKAQTWPDLAHP